MTLAKLLVLAAAVAATASCASRGTEPDAQGFRTSEAFYAQHEQPFYNVDSRKGNIYPMDASRSISEQDCTGPVPLDQGNLRCK